MWFYRQMLRMLWKEHVTNEGVLWKIGTMREIIFTIRKTVEIPQTHNEESILEEFNTHKK